MQSLRNVEPDVRQLEGRRRIELAMRACELSGWVSSSCLTMLAAAHAAAGEFDEAVHWAQAAQSACPEPGTL
jgi:hypothetical protein